MEDKMSAKIINLGNLDDEDEEFNNFLEGLRTEATRAVFIVEHKDGTVSVGTNSKTTKDVVYDLYRLQEFCRILVNGDQVEE